MTTTSLTSHNREVHKQNLFWLFFIMNFIVLLLDIIIFLMIFMYKR